VSNWEPILPIWYNNYFTIGCRSFLFRDLWKKGFVLVDDPMGNNMDVQVVDYIVNTLNIRTNVLQYNRFLPLSNSYIVYVHWITSVLAHPVISSCVTLTYVYYSMYQCMVAGDEYQSCHDVIMSDWYVCIVNLVR